MSYWFQNFYTYYFSYRQESKFSTVKDFLLDQVIFPQWMNFSTIKEFFHSQGIFPQSRNFSTVKEFFHGQRIFSQLWKFCTTKELFHNQGIFPQLWKSSKKHFYKQGSFPENVFPFIYKLSHKQRLLGSQKNFLQTKIKKVF